MKQNNNTYPFNTPQDYFDDFEARLFLKIEEERLPSSTGFKVPETYFEGMEQRMLDLSIEDDKQVNTIPLFPKKYFAYAAAAAACFLIGVLTINKNNDELTLENINISMVDQYIEDGNLNLELYDLTNYLDDGNISEINFEIQNIPEGSLENYLLDTLNEDILLHQGLNPFE